MRLIEGQCSFRTLQRQKGLPCCWSQKREGLGPFLGKRGGLALLRRYQTAEEAQASGGSSVASGVSSCSLIQKLR
jgi:hypothetical protein